MKKNKNIEKHNKKYHIGAVIQGATILDILKYSKNGKSTEFLWECKCGNEFVAGSSVKIKKLCPNCLEEYEKTNKTENSVPQRQVGIYTLRFRDIYYIGESLDLEKRKQQHQESLENNAHYNRRLQYMYNKGIRFQFEILESIEFVKGYNLYFKMLNLKKEQNYIKQYSENGYDILNTEDSFEKMRKIPELKKYYNDFVDLNLQSYDDILKLKPENNRRWNEFKSIFYQLPS